MHRGGGAGQGRGINVAVVAVAGRGSRLARRLALKALLPPLPLQHLFGALRQVLLSVARIGGGEPCL
jgi:hypothetical protein